MKTLKGIGNGLKSGVFELGGLLSLIGAHTFLLFENLLESIFAVYKILALEFSVLTVAYAKLSNYYDIGNMIFTVIIISLVFIGICKIVKKIVKTIEGDNLIAGADWMIEKPASYCYSTAAAAFKKNKADNTIVGKIFSIPYYIFKGLSLLLGYIPKYIKIINIGILVLVIGYLIVRAQAFGTDFLEAITNTYFALGNDDEFANTLKFVFTFTAFEIFLVVSAKTFWSYGDDNCMVNCINGRKITFTRGMGMDVELAKLITTIKLFEEHDDSKYQEMLTHYLRDYGSLFAKDKIEHDTCLQIGRDCYNQFFNKREDIPEDLASTLTQKYEKVIEIEKRAQHIVWEIADGKHKKDTSHEQEQQQKEQHTSHSKQETTLIYIKKCDNMEELDKKYKKLCLIYHPDMQNGDEDVMKQINAEYDHWKKILS